MSLSQFCPRIRGIFRPGIHLLHGLRSLIAMYENTYAGTPEWRKWCAEVRRTGRLFVPEFAPPEVVLDEGPTLKGLIVLHRELAAMEKLGHKAEPGQVLFWYGDYTQEDLPKGGRARNAYDVGRNVYAVAPHEGEIILQDELKDDREAALEKLERLGEFAAKA